MNHKVYELVLECHNCYQSGIRYQQLVGQEWNLSLPNCLVCGTSRGWTRDAEDMLKASRLR